MRCNLFKKLSSTTGEFLMFSQFTEDLARQATDGAGYRVSPSKFIAMDISGTDGVSNTKIPEILQNYYEDTIVRLKEEISNDDNHQWDPRDCNALLWNAFNTVGINCEHIRYIGDINFYNNHDVNNMIYDEIYCHIPASARREEYEESASDRVGYESISYANPPSGVYVSGWDGDTYPSDTELSGISAAEVKTVGESGLVPAVMVDTFSETQPTYSEDSSYNVNMIVVYYDVYNYSDATTPQQLYGNIPLGVYFTSKVEGGEFVNQIVKYVNNEDTFGQGSSYGIRIMTRLTPSANNTGFIEVGQDSDVASLAVMMGQLGDTIQSIRSLCGDHAELFNSIKDHIVQFKNYRTNVPYIRTKTVNGVSVPYWFVNGVDTGVPAIGEVGEATGLDVATIAHYINLINGNTLNPDSCNH